MAEESTDRISSKRLTSLLRGGAIGEDVTVVNVDSEVLTGGLMADTLALSLRYEGESGDEPRNVVVKLPSSNPDSHAMGMEIGAYAREISFYSEIASHLTIRVPHCYHASIDKQARTFTLLLEDARPAQIPHPEMEGCRGVAEKAITELARLHADTWGDMSYKHLPDMSVRLEETYLTRELDFAGRGWEIFRPLVEASFSSDEVACIDRILDSAETWMHAGEQSFCLIHGDFRFANLLLTASGEVVTLDWQTYLWGNPGCDLAHFLLISLSPKQQSDWSEPLFDVYLQELTASGVEGYDGDQLAFDYRIGILSETIMILVTIFAVGANDLSDQARDQMLAALRLVVPALQRYNVMELVDGEV